MKDIPPVEMEPSSIESNVSGLNCNKKDQRQSSYLHVTHAYDSPLLTTRRPPLRYGSVMDRGDAFWVRYPDLQVWDSNRQTTAPLMLPAAPCPMPHDPCPPLRQCVASYQQNALCSASLMSVDLWNCKLVEVAPQTDITNQHIGTPVEPGVICWPQNMCDKLEAPDRAACV